jgi:hypothetical protein
VIPPQIVSHALELPVCELLFPTHVGGFNQAKYHFVERRHPGLQLGKPCQLLASGAGRAIVRPFTDVLFCVEPQLRNVEGHLPPRKTSATV